MSHPQSIPRTIWSATVPLLITHADLPEHPPLAVSTPRLSYLALLLPRASAFFGRPCLSFHHEGVLLRNLAVGLLMDLYEPRQLPWRLTVDAGIGWDIADTFLNCAKEADFVRNGNSSQIMKLSMDDTHALWHAVLDNDYASFARVNAILLNPARPMKHIPIRVYVPTSPPAPKKGGAGAAAPLAPAPGPGPGPAPAPAVEPGSFKVVQSLVPMWSGGGSTGQPRVPTRLGPALHNMLPGLFPNSRGSPLAVVVLHGATVPFHAPLEELMREAAYPDGWLCFVVVVTAVA